MGSSSGRVGQAGERDRSPAGRRSSRSLGLLSVVFWLCACGPTNIPVAGDASRTASTPPSATRPRLGGCSETTGSTLAAPLESAPPACPPLQLPVVAGPASLAFLAEPDRLWIHDSWGGLGPSYDLEARLMRVGKAYEAECTVHVFPMAPDGMPVRDRFETKQVTVPGERVRSLVHALSGVNLEPSDPSLIELSPLDDNGEADVLLFPHGGGAPLFLHQGPNHDLSVDLERHYRIREPKEALAAYRSVLDAIDLNRWVEGMNQAAIKQAKSGRPPRP